MKNQYLGSNVEEEIDDDRILGQMEAIRDFMVSSPPVWHTLKGIEEYLGYPQASISANLRHLRKEQHGSYTVEKQRCDGAGTWEYRVIAPVLTPGLLPF